jgi:hypothetical protein
MPPPVGFHNFLLKRRACIKRNGNSRKPIGRLIDEATKLNGVHG